MVLGAGRPVAFLPGLSFTHEPPSRASRLWEQAALRRLGQNVELHWIGRRPGVPPGSTMTDFTEDYAEFLSARFASPIPVLGFSTGGLLGLQLAARHPDLIDRLVVAGTGHRVSDTGRAANLRWVEALTGGRPRDAWREIATDLVGSDRLRTLAGHFLAAVGPLVTPADCSDGIRTAVAETAFDIGPELPRITAPTLVVAGDRDLTCTPSILSATAHGIPGARLEVLPGVGHLGSLTSPAAVRAITAFLTS